MVYDVIIVGSGPGGATAALGLRNSGLNIAILDKASFPRDKICGDALSGKVVNILRKLSPELLNELYAFADKVDSWGVRFVAPNKNHLDIPFKLEYNTEKDKAPGYISKRIDFDNFLVQQVKKYSNINIVENFDVQDVLFEKDLITVRTKDGKQIEGRFIVGADGAQSIVAKKVSKFDVDPNHYCAGLRAYYEGVEGLHKDNYIELHFLKEFLPGYFWIFPLPNGAANIGVGMLSEKVSKNRVNLKEEMRRIIKEEPTIAPRFKNAKLVDDIKGFGLPLGSKKRSISGERYALIGDAASLIDPFTGEGIANAMISGYKAAEQIIKSFAENRFDAAFVKQYDEAVYRNLWGELRLSHAMQKMINYPWLFNFVVNKANKSKTLQTSLISMFDNIDMRKQLSSPMFYVKLLLNR